MRLLGISLCALLLACRAAPAPRTEPEPARALGFEDLGEHAVYLVLVDRFRDGDGRDFEGRDPSSPLAFHGGDLEGVRGALPYLADLGVTALWLTPVHEQVAAPVAGPAGLPHWPFHGYWPERHDAVDPRFGDEEALHRLLDDAHGRGLRVILDVVTNHYGYGAAGASDVERVRATETGTCDDEGSERTRCLFGLPDLRTELPGVRRDVVARTSWWAERFALDGLRFDAAKHVELDLLAAVHARAEKALLRRGGAEGFLTVAEHWGAGPGSDEARAYLERGAADTLFDFSFAGLVEGFLTGRLRAEALAHHLEAWHRAEGPPLVHWLSTHDTSPLAHRLEQAAARYPLAPFLQMSVRGLPLVTWGEELGRSGGDWPDNRAFMPWERLREPEGRALHDLWRSLLAARRASPALRSRAFRTLYARTDDDGATVVVLRGDERGAQAVVALRRGGATEVVVDERLPVAGPARVHWPARGPTLVHDDERTRLTFPADSAAVWLTAHAEAPAPPRLESE